MRITVQVPKDAAHRIQHFAVAASNTGIRNLGIRRVQVTDDSVISANVGGANAQPCDSKSLGKYWNRLIVYNHICVH